MRSLVLYYSQTGKTKIVAEHLAEALGGDIARFTCPAFERGFLGGIRQAWSIVSKGTPAIKLPEQADQPYDLVVLAGPVWAARPAPPLRSALVRRPPMGSRQALFLTCEGTSERFRGSAALEEAKALCPRPPVAATLFKAAEIAGRDLEHLVERFADLLRGGMDVQLTTPTGQATAPGTTSNLAKA